MSLMVSVTVWNLWRGSWRSQNLPCFETRLVLKTKSVTYYRIFIAEFVYISAEFNETLQLRHTGGASGAWRDEGQGCNI